MNGRIVGAVEKARYYLDNIRYINEKKDTIIIFSDYYNTE